MQFRKSLRRLDDGSKVTFSRVLNELVTAQIFTALSSYQYWWMSESLGRSTANRPLLLSPWTRHIFCAQRLRGSRERLESLTSRAMRSSCSISAHRCSATTNRFCNERRRPRSGDRNEVRARGNCSSRNPRGRMSHLYGFYRHGPNVLLWCLYVPSLR
jgi:hypothetical protein